MIYIHIGCDYENKEEFKAICRELDVQYDFDVYKKKWEARIPSQKYTKRNINRFRQFANKHDFTFHSWDAKPNQYKDSAYFIKGKKWEERA